MVRALATGDVGLKDWAGMSLRELGVAALLGATVTLAVEHKRRNISKYDFFNGSIS